MSSALHFIISYFFIPQSTLLSIHLFHPVSLLRTWPHICEHAISPHLASAFNKHLSLTIWRSPSLTTSKRPPKRPRRPAKTKPAKLTGQPLCDRQGNSFPGNSCLTSNLKPWPKSTKYSAHCFTAAYTVHSCVTLCLTIPSRFSDHRDFWSTISESVPEDFLGAGAPKPRFPGGAAPWKEKLEMLEVMSIF